ncbi:MAG TPA: DNA/RNA non-specific endonuclease, partial [Pyrinomonadaceae bacterium]|nr:DNA/RNA non-specific endonuclease [Pyrinomonadaceae bacterium]
LPSILSLVLQVLGLTPERIRGRIVRVIGERNMAIIEAVWDAIKAFIEGGPAALWEKIKEYLGNLKEMLVEAIQEWVVTKIIQSAVTKLVTMFNPVGAIIQAIITIYNTVMFLIERINQILEFVEAVVNSVDKIARGNIGDAASWIEKALARTIPIIISFLARLLGLGGIADKIKGFIQRLQTKVEQAIDKVIDKVVGAIKKLFAAGKSAVGRIVEWWKAKKVFKAADGETHTLYFSGSSPADAQLMIRSQPKTFVEFINGITVPAGNAPLEDAKKNALAAAQRIDKLKNRPPGEGTQDAEIRDRLDELAVYVSVLTAAAPTNPPSIVVYGGLTADKGGTYMDAEVLSNNVPEGSEPTDEPPIWKKANRRPGRYVQGHLLNHHVGGPGRAYNLTPITKRCNRRHNTQVEEDLKKVVLGGGVVRYKVKVNYGKHPDRPIQKKIEDRMKLYTLPQDQAKHDTDKKKLEALSYEQNNIPLALDASWAVLQYNGTKWVDKDVKPPVTIACELDDDENLVV